MESLDWESGLIRYTSEAASNGRKSAIWRPKTIAYGLALLVAITGLVWSVSSQAPLDVAVIQVRQPLFVRLSDGNIQNSYELHLQNKTNEALELAIMMHGLAGAELDVGRFDALTLAPQRSLRVLVRVRWRSSHSEKGSRSFFLDVIPQQRRDIAMVSAPATFYMPGNSR